MKMRLIELSLMACMMVTFAALLGGCETLPPKVETVYVKVPVPAPCLGPATIEPELPKDPGAPEERAALLQAYIRDLRYYIIELHSRMSGCK